MKIPFVDLKAQYTDLKNEIDEAVLSAFEQGSFIMGPRVESFENKISTYLGKDSLSCASGSDALLLALMASGIGNGDEVITSPFTFFATAGAIARLGAKPVFIDIDPDTFNLDPELIKKKITKKTKAIIPVHIFGQSADMSKIAKIARDNKIVVIEDTCQAFGAEYKGKKLGTIGDFGCFSFFPTKNLGGAGDGGLVTCKSPKMYKKLKMLRLHGAKKKYFHELVGINSRLDSLQASVLEIKLAHVDKWNNKRVSIAKKYTQELKDIVKIPFVDPNAKHIFHQYALLTDKRDSLMKYLNDRGISSGIYYPQPLHLQKCFKELGYKKGDLPIAEKTSKRVLSLPIYAEMTDEQIGYVISSVKEFFAKN